MCTLVSCVPCAPFAGVSALAVVDDAGTLVASLSSSDLHGLPEANFRSLAEPIHEWMKTHKPASLVPYCTSRLQRRNAPLSLMI